MANLISSPQLIVGDFNDITNRLERKCGGPIYFKCCNEFSAWIDNHGFLDMGWRCLKFTQRGTKIDGQERIFRRLDRAICNQEWRIIFSKAIVKILLRVYTDHHPLLINLREVKAMNRDCPFRFKATGFFMIISINSLVITGRRVTLLLLI